MIDKALDWFIPHICSSCGQVGSLMCLSCEDDIIEQSFDCCLLCLKPCYGNNLCRRCRPTVAYEAAYAVGWRHESLKTLINNYKFERAQAGAAMLADLLDRRLPVLPSDTVVSYIPTIPAHIRQRGFDHMKLIADGLAHRRRLESMPLLTRQSYAVQHGASRQQRLKQAQEAFRPIDKTVEGPILLIDDIFTTGATVVSAGQVLRTQFKKPLILAIIARQPLDDLDDL